MRFMKLEKVSEKVYANTTGETGGNVGIIVLDDQVLAVDAQYPVSGAEFRRSISDYSDKPVTHLLLTHVHGDHIFGNQAFDDVEIVSHRRLKEKMVENLKTVWSPENIEKMIDDVKKNRPERAYLFEGLRIVLPTKTFDEQINIGDIEMFHLPGHTDCSSVIYVSDDKVLFAGDLMFARTFPWAGDPTANPDEWIEAFKEILKMDVVTFVPGHGPLCGKNEFSKQLVWFETVKEELKKLIAEGATEEEAVNYDGYPPLYDDTGDRKTRSLKHWYNFYSKNG